MFLSITKTSFFGEQDQQYLSFLSLASGYFSLSRLQAEIEFQLHGLASHHGHWSLVRPRLRRGCEEGFEFAEKLV